MDLDMGEDKLVQDLLFCPPHCQAKKSYILGHCQAKKSYILGNNVFFSLSEHQSPSNNHTKID
jgi:hypothetical protein